MASPPQFTSTELERALQEQLFGIASFQMSPPSDPLQAVATVTLLEGRQLTISLSSRGYHIDDSRPTQGSDERIFETIEDLLTSASDAYEMKKAHLLFEKLESL